MSRLVGTLGAVAFGLATGSWSSTAYACSCDVSAIYRSEPADGAVDVPPNQAIVLTGSFVGNGVTWVDDSGEAVEFELNQGETPGCPRTLAELVPRSVLRPDTSYVVEVEPIYPELHAEPQQRASIRFTTGNLITPERMLVPPKGCVTTVVGVPTANSTCDEGEVLSYVALDDARDVEILATAGGEIIMRWLLPESGDEPATWSSSFQFELVPDCIEFRRRSPTGARSAPLAFCGDELDVLSYRDATMDPSFLACHDDIRGKQGSDDLPSSPTTPAEPEPLSRAANEVQSLAAEPSRAGSDAFAANAQPHSDGCSVANAGSSQHTLTPWLVLLPLATRWRRRRV